MTTPRSPKSPARKPLPPVYLVVDEDGALVSEEFHNSEAQAQRDVEYPGDRIVKYLPAPVPPRSRKGGSR